MSPANQPISAIELVLAWFLLDPSAMRPRNCASKASKGKEHSYHTWWTVHDIVATTRSVSSHRCARIAERGGSVELLTVESSSLK